MRTSKKKSNFLISFKIYLLFLALSIAFLLFIYARGYGEMVFVAYLFMLGLVAILGFVFLLIAAMGGFGEPHD